MVAAVIVWPVPLLVKEEYRTVTVPDAPMEKVVPTVILLVEPCAVISVPASTVKPAVVVSELDKVTLPVNPVFNDNELTVVGQEASQLIAVAVVSITASSAEVGWVAGLQLASVEQFVPVPPTHVLVAAKTLLILNIEGT